MYLYRINKLNKYNKLNSVLKNLIAHNKNKKIIVILLISEKSNKYPNY